MRAHYFSFVDATPTERTYLKLMDPGHHSTSAGVPIIRVVYPVFAAEYISRVYILKCG